MAEFAKYHQMITGRAPDTDAVAFAVDPQVSSGGNDAYAIVSSGPRVTITGSNERSLWYGLYDLLERRGGCGWFWDGDVVPQRDAIDLSGLDVREESRFAYRGIRYFAHRGLTRFQAEHWGPEDWKREIDWCLKKRLNLFMLRIGQDDLFQKAFPETCAYPDASKPLPGQGKGYDNRSLFWPLEYRGKLRKLVMDYAFARGLMAPEDFGTMTHWYSRTPQDFLDNAKPDFLPQNKGAYSEPSGLVWDIRQKKWLAAYWKLTETSVSEYGRPDLLHTIGVAERKMSPDPEENRQRKIEWTNMLLSGAKIRYPSATRLLAGWDLYCMGTPGEVKKFLKHIPNDVLLWDYEADAYTKTWFGEWDVIGKRPYVFGVFMAYEAGLDARTDYAKIAERQKLVADDPMCKGYILWPESSHVDSVGIEWFAKNSWRADKGALDPVLTDYCARRYPDDAAAMKELWLDTIPASTNMQLLWRKNAFLAVLREFGEGLLKPDGRKNWPAAKPDSVFAGLPKVVAGLKNLDWDKDERLRRDMTDIARVWADRLAVEAQNRMVLAYYRWLDGDDAAREDFCREGSIARARMSALADLLALHTDFSVCDAYDRLRQVHPVTNPDFISVLVDNAANSYCASHQAELARHCYIPAFDAFVELLKKKMREGDRTPLERFCLESFRTRAIAMSFDELRLNVPRKRAAFNRALDQVLAAARPRFSVVTCGGVPRLAADGVPCVGTAAMPSPKVAPGRSVAALADFDRQGVRFFSDIWMMNDKRYLPRVWWRGEGDYDFATFDALVQGLLDATPEGFVFPRIKLDPPESWIAAHPEEMFGGTVRPESAAWRTLYRRMLRDMVAHVEAAPYADRIAGYHLGALHCGEWVFHGADYQQSLPADPAARRARSREITRNVADAVVDAARFLRECTRGQKLIGSFFGYSSYAHEDLFTVLESKAVDFFAAPPHYEQIRENGFSGRSQAYYQASYRLHGSVYYEESDFRTFLSDPTCSFPPKTRMRPLDESLALMRRSVGKCLAGGWENWWFLLGGNATFSHPDMLATVRVGVEEQRRSLHTPWTPADVAVFTSPNEFATSVGAPNLDLRAELKVKMQTATLPSCGVTFDSYVLEDIADPRLPDYNVYFFPNAFTLTPDLRAAIEKRTSRPGKTAIFIRQGEPAPEATALREKFRAAGAHVWLESGDILAAGRGYLMIHAASDGEKTIRLPDVSDVQEIFGAAPDRRRVASFVEKLRKGETRVYRLRQLPDLHPGAARRRTYVGEASPPPHAAGRSTYVGEASPPPHAPRRSTCVGEASPPPHAARRRTYVGEASPPPHAAGRSTYVGEASPPPHAPRRSTYVGEASPPPHDGEGLQSMRLTEPRLWHGADGATLPYRLHVPANPESGRRYPLVIHMHGAGSRGTNNVSQIKTGGADFIRWATRRGHEFVFLAPQCPKGLKWVDTNWGDREHRMAEEPTPWMKMTLDLIDDAVARYPVDRNRIYVMGISMGGYATWELLQRRPELVAAALPCCGGGDVTFAARLTDIPIWAFHGDADKVVPTYRSQSMVAAIRAAGGTKILYREYPGVGHNAWTPTFSDPKVFEWLFEQERNALPIDTCMPKGVYSPSGKGGSQ